MIQTNDLLFVKNNLSLKYKERIYILEKESVVKVTNKTKTNIEKIFSVEILFNNNILNFHIWSGDKYFIDIYNKIPLFFDMEMLHIDFIKTNFLKINT